MLFTSSDKLKLSSENRSLYQSITFGFGLLVAIINLYAVSFEISILEYLSKPLIMPLLGLYFFIDIYYAKAFISSRIINGVITAFIFSWLGDILLLFSELSFNYFLGGILCFLITQILYINLFNKLTIKKLTLKSFFLYAVPFLVYLTGFYSMLWASLDTLLKVAVLFYAIALTTMGVFALSRKGRSDEKSFWLILIGGVLFIFSDSFIAYSKFIYNFSGASFMIMFTYIIAQILIMLGIKTFLLRFSSE